MKNTSGIYAFRNKKDGKVYVGQSKTVLTRRTQHERGDTSNSRRFHNAMKKYGADGFDFRVLEYCEIDSLNEKEAFWVEKLNSLYPNGYNLTTGGGAFQKHHPETLRRFSENQKKRVREGKHPFTTSAFIGEHSKRQKKLASEGKHSSQRSDVKEKRNKTVQERIAENGKFFSHSQSEIDKKRQIQVELYSHGKGKFQQSEFIEKNTKLVKKKLAEGKRHSQQDGWSEKQINAHRHEMKRIVLAIRTNEGKTIEKEFESLHEASRQLNADRAHITSICKDLTSVISVSCNLGKIIKGVVGSSPNWKLSELKKIPDSTFTNKKSVTLTIETLNGRMITQTFASQREACRELEAQHRALRYMLKGEKYKSTGCNIGRIIKAVESLE